METYPKLKIPPPVPPKYRKLGSTPILQETPVIQENNGVVKIIINNSEPVSLMSQAHVATSHYSCTKISLAPSEDPLCLSFSSLTDENGRSASPTDNLDSGTCSDVDRGTPPLIKDHYPKIDSSINHKRCGSLNSSGIGMDSDEDSCDSINSSEFCSGSSNGDGEPPVPVIQSAIFKADDALHDHQVPLKSLQRLSLGVIPENEPQALSKNTCEPSSQRQKERVKFTVQSYNDHSCREKDICSIEEIDFENTDKYMHFHLNENAFNADDGLPQKPQKVDTGFAGLKDIEETEENGLPATIKSSRGTVRGVKNRVRAGIATFLQIPKEKTWQEKEVGKVVLYTTSMGIVRETYHRCLKVRQILKTHLVKFDEKDVFMNRQMQIEMKERMNTNDIRVPQLFVEGIYIGDAEVVERLNETGELRKMMKPYKSPDACNTCQMCGGYRMLPCGICNGSKKSIHRNQFTTELVSLRCVNCDEVGLVKCHVCCS